MPNSNNKPEFKYNQGEYCVEKVRSRPNREEYTICKKNSTGKVLAVNHIRFWDYNKVDFGIFTFENRMGHGKEMLKFSFSMLEDMVDFFEEEYKHMDTFTPLGERTLKEMYEENGYTEKGEYMIKTYIPRKKQVANS